MTASGILWYHKTQRPYIPPDFLDGINLLLDQQHDKAIKAFVDLFEVNADTIEIHIVLGGLFRQKGEFDKAIDIHQNIIERYRSNNPYRIRAMFELAKDYYHAGLLGHAEEVLQRLVSSKDKNIAQESSRYLLMLYEAEKNWEQAINLGRKIMTSDKKNKAYKQRITHYYCEMAQLALDKDNELHARHLIGQAKNFIAESFRVTLLLGDIERASNNTNQAMQYYERALHNYPKQAMIVLPRLLALLQDGSAQEVCAYIKRLNPKIKTSSYMLEYAHALMKAGQDHEAERLLTDILAKKQVCMPLLGLILENKLQQVDQNSKEKEFFLNIMSAINIDNAKRYAYSCLNCAFESHQHYWCCPSCRSWDTCIPLDLISEPEHKEAA